MSPPTNGQGEESDRNWRDNFYNFVESLYHSKSYVAFVVSTMFQWIHSSPFFRCTVDKESKRHISVLIGKFSKQKIMMMIFLLVLCICILIPWESSDSKSFQIFSIYFNILVNYCIGTISILHLIFIISLFVSCVFGWCQVQELLLVCCIFFSLFCSEVIS